jgi:hypothetical protein
MFFSPIQAAPILKGDTEIAKAETHRYHNQGTASRLSVPSFPKAYLESFYQKNMPSS